MNKIRLGVLAAVFSASGMVSERDEKGNVNLPEVRAVDTSDLFVKAKKAFAQVLDDSAFLVQAKKASAQVLDDSALLVQLKDSPEKKACIVEFVQALFRLNSDCKVYLDNYGKYIKAIILYKAAVVRGTVDATALVDATVAIYDAALAAFASASAFAFDSTFDDVKNIIYDIFGADPLKSVISMLVECKEFPEIAVLVEEDGK